MLRDFTFPVAETEQISKHFLEDLERLINIEVDK